MIFLVQYQMGKPENIYTRYLQIEQLILMYVVIYTYIGIYTHTIILHMFVCV